MVFKRTYNSSIIEINFSVLILAKPEKVDRQHIEVTYDSVIDNTQVNAHETFKHKNTIHRYVLLD